MKNDHYSIGEVSRIKDISVKALRFYEKIGLLKPCFIDPVTRYRYYHKNQFMMIDVIKAARCMQISPNALVPYFAEKDTAGLIALINKHKNEIFARIAGLQKIIENIEGVTNTLGVAKETNKSGHIFERTIPERHAITLPFDPEKTEDSLLEDYSRLDSLVISRGLNNNYEAGVVCKGTEQGFYPEYIFTSVSLKADEYEDYRSIPQGTYICIVVSKENAQRQAEKLFSHILKSGKTPQLLIQKELLTDLFASESEYFEFQVKV